MVKSTIKFTASKEQRPELLRILRPLVDPTQSLRGCVECFLSVDVRDESRIWFITTWSNREDLDRYIRSEMFLSVLTAMDLCSRPPEVAFEDISSTQGIEYIKEVRSHPEPTESHLAFSLLNVVQI